ncbi:SDR family NAD(P)-dependent oxidoreductase [Chitinophaga pendula]|uniref:SDR family NAD(P)-dependent oxidoreductase n=1 Tax=Chitinophaga TaxID=79328 RepID=UPI0018DF189E|nr:MULTISPECIES: SDR family NAD(P)-dependent oxidoreductase [Chitinophaga]UCJ09797.1 SDR family NAD(P)-dependent oxidoreductase [Chitinophaga pendula]
MEPKSNHTLREEIAVIGISCRFPGAENYHSFWDNLINSRFSVTEIPSGRWDAQQYYGDPLKEANKTNSKWGGFISDIDMFDPLFFGISPKEAKYIDPQHRLFLQAVWHTIEDAGYSTESLSGKKIGIYAGVSKNDYAEMLQATHQEISPFVSTGTVHSILTNRVSFLLNLSGKSEVVDTACSSSLVALHNAIRDIRCGTCEAAIVGGVNALLTPTMYLSHGKSGMLSGDGKCKTFDESANGYVRAEGVGCLFIKPLRKAIADNDNIIGIIKGTAVNHNGRSNSMTSPSAVAQADVINAALADAGLEASEISYIEAHGTATPLGDPIEISGLKKVFAPFVQHTGVRCGLGSVKTNIGHLESAAGMAGLIKVLMCLKHKKLPAVLHYNKLNPYIDLKDTPFYIVDTATDWKANGLLTAGVSSFGMGGVNAHVIVQEYQQEKTSPANTDTPYQFPLSARSATQLKRYAADVAAFLHSEKNTLHPADIAYTLQKGRDHLSQRIAFADNTITGLIAQLTKFADGQSEDCTDMSLRKWIEGGNHDWQQTGQRVALPGYPFEKRRCWADAPTLTVKPATQTTGLITQYLPTNDPLQFTCDIYPSDYFVRDHIVQDTCLLPGVAYLEIARGLLEKHFGLRAIVVSDILWMYPVKVYDTPVQLRITLQQTTAGYNFEIASEEGIHATGQMQTTAATAIPASINLDDVKLRCKERPSVTSLYQQFRNTGLQYKASFQPIREAYFSTTEALCLLSPEQRAAGNTWEPSLLDGVFQTVVGLCIYGDVQATGQLLPFHLDTLQCDGPLKDACYAYVRKAAAYREGHNYAFDMYLCDHNGRVILSFNMFVKRNYHSGSNKPSTDMLYYTSTWAERTLGVLAATPAGILLFDYDNAGYDTLTKAFPSAANILVTLGQQYQKISTHHFCIDPTDPEAYTRLLKELQQVGVRIDNIVYRCNRDTTAAPAEQLRDIYALLYLSQALIRAGHLEKIRLLYTYSHSDSVSAAIKQMMGGFARTLYYENPRLAFTTIGISEEMNGNGFDLLAQELKRYTNTPLREILYRNNRREERVVIKTDISAAAAPLIRENGCYLITGGTGGLGMVFARYLVSKYKATVILVGRRAFSPAIDQKLQTLNELGGKACYFTADASNEADVADLIRTIHTQVGALNGVLHAAGLIEDAFIINKNIASFERVVAPKVLGTVCLDEYTKKDPLDFFIVFSSIASLMPNQGQCDYAAANNFLDHYMQARKGIGHPGVSLAINWPLWENGGIDVADHEREHLWEVFGMKPMSHTSAIKSFEQLLSAGLSYSQAVVIEGIQQKIEQHLNVIDAPTPTTGTDLASLLRELIRPLINKNTAIDDNTSFNTLGVDSRGLVQLADGLQTQMGVQVNPITLIEHNTIKRLSAFLENEPLTITVSHTPKASLIDVNRAQPAALMFNKRFYNDEFYMQDHVVDGKYNVPGACYIEMARQAAALAGMPALHLYNNYWPEVLSSPGAPIDAHIRLFAKDSVYDYEITSRDTAGNNTVHAMGSIGTNSIPELGSIDLSKIKGRIANRISREQVYTQIIAEGLHVGPSFMPMEELWANKEEALGHLKLPLHVADTAVEYVLHPSLLTGVFQTAIINNKPKGVEPTRFIPVAIDEIRFIGPLPTTCYVHTIAHEANSRTAGIKKFDAWVADETGHVVARLVGFAIREISGNTSSQQQQDNTTTAGSAEVEKLLMELLYDGIGVALEELDAETSFQDYGINSRMIIDLNQRLAGVFGNLSKTLFFEYQNIRELSAYFQQKHAAVLQQQVVAPVEETIITPVTPPANNNAGDIAVVGIGGKYPQADNIADFWKILKEGRDCVVEIPEDRFDYKPYFNEDREKELLYAKWGGFINDVDKFDPLFFNISPREAEQMDPQERLFLEVVWATLEDAGITREKMTARSRKVGVFVGALWQPYVNLGVEQTSLGNPLAPSGLLYSIPNRVSYFFNWTGPSVAIDTACSASLTALHYACESIRNGECDSCIAGGVNLSLSLSKYLFLSQHNFLATDGRCRSFGIGDGYVPGEGIGAVLLKPLDAAIADGDQIYGVIKGSAVNHGGRTNGYTVPSPNQQAALIADVLHKTQIDPRTISYVEAHGTGTSLGDPIEITGLCKAFQPYTSDKQYCAIGSVKSNIGHLEAAAGIAGLTKILLQFKHQELAPSLHAATLNPNITFENTPFYVQREHTSWKQAAAAHPRRAMLSSFGAGGSNAHIIVEDFHREVKTRKYNFPAIVTLSATNIDRLQDQIRILQQHLQQQPDLDIHAIAHSLQSGREAMEERYAWVATDTRDWLRQLSNTPCRSGNKVTTQQQRKGEEARTAVQQFINTANWQGLAQHWMKGHHVDWSLLYNEQQPQRISLPAYPFARERYWLPLKEKCLTPATNSLHPLLHTNTSTLDEQQYTSIFSGTESFLTHHRVWKDKILPGVASLEWVRAAGSLSTGQLVTQLKNVSWLTPLWVKEGDKQAHITLYRNAQQIGYETYSDTGIHNTGHLSTASVETPAPLDIRQLLHTMTAEVDHEQIYTGFDAAGLNLGPDFQRVMNLYKGNNAALTRIRPLTGSGMVYPPAILDSLLHAIYGLMMPYKLMLPYHVGEVTFCGEPEHAKELWGYAVRKPDQDPTVVTADFYLLNESGKVLVFLRDFIFLPTDRTTTQKKQHTSFYQPEWIHTAGTEVPSLEEAAPLLLIAGGTVGLCDKLQDILGQEVIPVIQDQIVASFVQVLNLVKEKISLRSRTHITLVCQQADYTEYAFITGLFRTMQLENPLLSGKVLVVDSLSLKDISQIVTLIEAEHNKDGVEVRHIQGAREEKTLQPLSSGTPATIREGGVYLVTGGAGVLGQLAAAYISRTEDTQIILTGRSLQPPHIDIPGAVYYPCDVSKLDAVKDLIKQIKAKHGAINGVIHAAGVIRDSFIINKTNSQIQEVFDAKVLGAINLDMATREEPLDFMIYYTSVTGQKGNIGQSDYAAANAFLDNYAVYRNQERANGKRNGKTLSISWPLWEEGGMRVNEDTARYLEKHFGMHPLPSAEGMIALDTLLTTAEGVVMVSYLSGAQETIQVLPTAGSIATPAATPDALQEEAAIGILRIMADILKMKGANIKRNKAFGDYGFDSVTMSRFANTLNATYHLELLPTVFYNHPTVEELALHLATTFPAAVHRAQNIPQQVALPAAVSPVTDRTVARPVRNAVTPPRVVNDDGVAIVGISARFPGSPDVNAFWENIRDEKDLITEIPADRWDWTHYYGDPLKEKNKTKAKWGGFITDIDKFDPLFFNISPREAELMDPQQRIALEAVYHALEDAGIVASQLKGSNTAVFIGVSTSDYSLLVNNQTDLTGQAHYATGAVHSVLVNRISYLLDLWGPSEPVDTACSSSLIAILRAAEQIRSGRSSIAIAGGVNALLSPELTLSFSEAGMLSEDGRCKTFDQSANGYVRSEGVGMVILKSLKQAQADGDHIYGVIRGAAENHGGKANTLTSPNPKAQQELIVTAYKEADIDPRDVSYMEAHGTGTPLGDPIEMDGLRHAFASLYKIKQVPQPTTPHCTVGSVKANIGHLEAAAGIAGVIKVLLALKHRTLPGNPHLSTPNEFLKLEGAPFTLQQRTAPWQIADNKTRIAGVSSFGFGGANAHVIIEEYIPATDNSYMDTNPAVIILSARTSDRLLEKVSQLITFINTNPDSRLHDMAYTLQTGREHMDERLAIIAQDPRHLKSQLEDFLIGDSADVFTGNITTSDIDLLLEGEAGKAYLHAAVANNELRALAKLWTKGTEIDWRLLYNHTQPARISLPGYPFARNRYWLPQTLTSPQTSKLHPLVHSNTSDLNIQQYTSTYTGNEVFLSDHRVRGQKILPGVAYLELARAAGTLAAKQQVIQLRHVSWLKPFFVGNTPQDIHISLHPATQGISYEVTGDTGIHSTGNIITGAAAATPTVDLHWLKAHCTSTQSGIYDVFLAEGLQLGESFRGVKQLNVGASEALSVIQLPGLAGCMYTPGILDSLLHTICGLVQPYRLALPYFVKEVNFYQPVEEGKTLYGYARKTPGTNNHQQVATYDLDLLNEQGQVLLSLREFSALSPDGTTTDPKTEALEEAPLTTTHHELEEAVATKLREVIAQLAKVTPEEIDDNRKFGDYGFDSVLLTRFANALNEYYNIELVPTVFYNYPTVNRLKTFLAESNSIVITAKHARPAAQRVTAPVPAKVNGLRFRKLAAQPTPGTNSPVAIVGISGRFPGAPDLKTFWEQLRDNKDLITEIPADRWDWKKYDGDPLKEKNKTKARWGGFITDIDKFDSLFFNISPREAELMDPQQRILLESVYHALEDAAIAPDQLKGTNTGVFIGVSGSDYASLVNSQTDLAGHMHFTTGYVHSILVNRISYLLDLYGPSEPIDTACSSSLIAIHRAVENIRNGTCHVAIAGGVNALITPELTLSFSHAGMLSEEGRCKTFDKSANGYVRGEGVGVVILKSLAQAIADGDHIYGVIKGTAENHGGKANTLTSPNPLAQRDLLLQAYRSAGVNPADVTYIEAHGTGTPLGDPIETEGLKLAFTSLLAEQGLPIPAQPYCSIGSVKTNIGHLEAAAGIAGVMKVLLAMQHRQLPGNPHLKSPNEYLQLDGSPFRLQQHTSPWTTHDNQPMIAGVSSFGFGGANAHLVIEEYIPTETAPFHTTLPAVIILSAKDKQALLQQAENLHTFLLENQQTGIYDIAYTLQYGRDTFEERLALVTTGNQHLLQHLAAYRSGDISGWYTGNTKHNKPIAAISDDPASLANAWTTGAAIDWDILYPQTRPAKISLPAYPFTKYRYWVPEGETPTRQQPLQQIHPLLHINESDLLEQRFTNNYTGNESFLYDHKVREEKILPGVAYLEIARVAGAISLRKPVTQLRQVTWTHPIRVNTPVNIQVNVRQEENNTYYEVRSCTSEEIVHSSGDLYTDTLTAPATVDIATLKAAATMQLPGRDMYEVFKTAGLQLGDTYRGVQTMYASPGACLSEIALPTLPGCTYTPGILDSMLHTVYGMLKARGQRYTLMLPYFMEEVSFCQPLDKAASLFAYARSNADSNAGGYDIDLLNEKGEVLLAFRNFIALPLNSPDNDTDRIHLYQYEWTASSPVKTTTAQKQQVWLAGSMSLMQKELKKGGFDVTVLPATNAVDYFSEVLEKVRSLPESANTQVNIIYLAEEAVDFGFIAGLLKSAVQEMPGFIGKVIRIDNPDLSAVKALLEEEQYNHDPEVAYEGTKRYIRRLQPLKGKPASTLTAIREKGVYLITGGAGGLGKVFAEYISQIKGTRLILTGRNTAAPAWLPANAAYIPCDISDPKAVAALIKQIKTEHPAIHGIIHSAGAVRDSLIRHKTPEQWQQVILPKVEGTRYLDEATRNEPLDFMVLFSSVASVMGNVGQADYAAANAFLDHYAHYRNSIHANGKTLSINWPLWKEGGMQVNATVEQYLEQQFGMLPMPTNIGLDLFEQLLKTTAEQCMVIYGKDITAIRNSEKQQDAPVDETLQQQVKEGIIAIVCQLLKLEVDRLDLHQEFGEYGFDSVLLTAFAQSLNSVYALDTTPALFYTHSTITTLATFLAKEYPANFGARKTADIALPVFELPAKVRTRKRTSAVTPATEKEGVAIVGISGRFPGSPDLDSFWNNLYDNKDLITEIPADRWDWKQYYGDPTRGAKQTKAKWGGFIEDIDKFDPLFFNISPKEAALMDPQQRITLEAVYQALEDAGIASASLRGTDAGIFIGVSSGDYAILLNNGSDAVSQAQFSTGAAHSVLVNRISYLLDIHGPSEPIDTACSSSLIAIHRGTEHIRNGHGKMAIAGGVNAILSPELTLSFSQAGMLSEDGRCKTFDQRANGYVRGEGVGIVILKALSAARADGDHIYGIIRGTAENHGGRANSLTSPNPKAQRDLLLKAYRAAGTDPRDITYIEAHGTGTALGDPVEIEGLKLAFKDLYNDWQLQLPDAPYCYLGSVKTNIGHLESAAGIAGVIKVLQSMQHRSLPGNPHLQNPNAFLKTDNSPFRLLTSSIPWSVEPGKKRVAGISSFGFGGANAHIVIEEYQPPAPAIFTADNVAIIPLSAKNKSRLLQLVNNLAAHLEKNTTAGLHNIARTLQHGRDALQERAVFIAMDKEELLDLLHSYATEHKQRLYSSSQVPLAQRMMAETWLNGEEADWDLCYPGKKPAKTSLPTYPFARDRYWVPQPVITPLATGSTTTTPLAASHTAAAPLAASHTLATPPVRKFESDHLYTCDWSRITTTPYVPSVAGKHFIIATSPATSLALAMKQHLQGTVAEADGQIPQDITDIYLLQGLTTDTSIDGLGSQELAVFRTIKQLLDTSYATQPLNITVFTHNTQKVGPADRVSAAGSGIVGLIGSLAKEQPLWKCRVIDVDEITPANINHLLSCPFNHDDVLIAYRKGTAYQRDLCQLELPACQQSKFRMQGTYVLLGGAGGIGKTTSAYLVENYQAQVIWLGRRPLDKTIEQAQDEIGQKGNRPIYIQCDANNSDDIQKARAIIKEQYQCSVNGLFHSAIVLNDKLMKNMSEDDFIQSFAVKASASQHLIEAFKEETLDFICFYSSVQSQWNAPGQANYSAGCTYKDSFAHSLTTRQQTPVHIINWGYWGDVGVVASANYQQRMERLGIGSISPDTGMDMLELILANNESQVAAVKFI